MAFLVILIILIFQRLTHILHKEKIPHWLGSIFKQLQRLEKSFLFKKSVYAQILGMLIPVPLAVGLLSILFARINIFLLFGFNLVTLWYCLGDSRFKYCRETHQGVDTFFMAAYVEIFAILFWFVLLGSAGAILYYSTNALIQYLEQRDTKITNQIEAILHIRGILDWVPIRLLGLTFALVGHFFMTTSDWLKHLIAGVSLDHQLFAEYGEKSINFNTHNIKEEKEHAAFLIERALWLWLIVLSIINLVVWIG